MIPNQRLQLGFFTVVSLLVVILTIVYQRHHPFLSDDSTSASNDPEEHSQLISENNALEDSVVISNGNGDTECCLKKINEPPNMQFLIAFPNLRICKTVSIPVQIGTNYWSFGILLLEDDAGKKVENIKHQASEDPVKINTNILKEWLNGNGREPKTWATVIDVLNTIHLDQLADDIGGSCEEAVLSSPFQGYVYDHVLRLAKRLRKCYRKLDLIDPNQNLLNTLGSLSLPFVMPKLSNDSEFDEVLTDLELGSRLLITGRPGVGKSTLIRYVTKMWANELVLTHCELLFRVPLLNTIHTLESLIGDNSCNTIGSMDIQQVAEEIRDSDGNGVCVLLDSFDEYRQSDDKGRDFILNVLEQNHLSEFTIIVTTRPEVVNDIDKDFEHKIEISGFDSKDIHTYIEKLPSLLNETISAALEKYPSVKLLCSTPLHLTMMVRLAHFDVRKLSFLTTETSLYIQFLFLTVKQYNPRQLTWTTNSLEECFTDKLSSSVNCQLFRSICKLGYEALLNGEQSFNSTLLPKEHHDKAKNLSLFRIETMPAPLDDDSVLVYNFSHRTFHEFIAACHLYMVPQEYQLSELYWLQNMRYQLWDDTYIDSILVLKFFFGLLGKYDLKALKTNFKYLSYRNRHCCNKSTVLELDVDYNIHLLEYAFEAGMKGSNLVEIIDELKVIVGPEFSDELQIVTWRPKDYLLLDHALQHIPVQRLVLDIWGLPNTAVYKHWDEFNHDELVLEHLTLCSFPLLPKESMNMILSIVPMVHLAHIVLKIEHGVDLRILLRSLSIDKIRTLEIEEPDVEEVDETLNTSFLSSNLKHMTSLESFKLNMYLNSTGMLAICDALVSMPNLHTLFLSVVDMNTKATNMLVMVLRSLHQLTSFSLNDIKDRNSSPGMHNLSMNSNFEEGSNIFSCDVLEGVMGDPDLLLLEHLRLNIDGSKSCNCTKLLIGLFNLRHLKKLELNLTNCECNPKVFISEVVHQYTKLEFLAVGGNLLDPDAQNLIIEIIHFSPHLKFLQISAIHNLLPFLADELRNLNELQHLILHHATDDSEHSWVNFSDSLKHLTSLVHLDLSDNGIKGTSSAVLLKSLISIPLLGELNLSHNPLESTGATYLSESLFQLTQLTNLNLRYTLAGDDGLRALAASLKYLKKLTVLSLGWNKFGDEGTLALAETLPHLSELEYLDLSYNEIGDEGALALVDNLLNAPSTVYLDLERTKISRKGARDIKERLNKAFSQSKDILSHFPKFSYGPILA